MMQCKVLPIEGSKITQENGALYLEGYANTKGQADRYGDIPTVYNVKRNYVYELKEYLENPVLLIDHKNSGTRVIGKMVAIAEDEKGLKFKAELMSESPLAEIQHCILAAKKGYLRGISIAGMFHYENPDAPNQLTLAEIFEISLVAVGADSNALADAVQKALKTEAAEDKNLAEIKRFNNDLRTADEIKKLAREIAARK